MTATPSGPHLYEITVKWRDLANRRLAYFTELYHSGRWEHYYTQDSFAMRMLDVIKAAKVWGELADKIFATRIPTGRDDRLRRAA